MKRNHSIYNLLSGYLKWMLTAALVIPMLFSSGETKADTLSEAKETVAVSLGLERSAFLKADGGLWLCGSLAAHYAGRDGDGYVPVKLLDHVKMVSLGERHGAAIREDGSLWLWGDNNYGQLGNGKTTDSKPTKLMDGVVAVSLGGDHSAAIKKDGSLWLWGNNYNGQLGTGNHTDSLVPVKVMDGVAAVSLGGRHSAAIKKDGSLWLWGWNASGQLGNGSTTASSVPVKVLENVKAVSLGGDHSAAVKEDGSLWLWGANESGQVGNGTTSSCLTPVRVMQGVKEVSLGAAHSAAVTEDGALWLWGNNFDGQLGNGSTEDCPEPVRIMGGVRSAAMGATHSAVLMEDVNMWNGNLQLWGDNMYGQLGLGNTTNRPAPAILSRFSMPLSGAAVSFTSSGWVYDGSAKTPAVAVTVGAMTLTAGKDYSVSYTNNTNAGTATATVSGMDDYEGTISKTFSIGRASLKTAEISLAQSGFIFDGQPKTPSASVKLGGRTLASGKDYTVSYSHHTNAGTGTITITGTGNYTDTASKTFTIGKADQKFSGLSSTYTLTEGGSMSLSSARVTSTQRSASGSVTVVSEAAKTYSSSDPSVVSVDKNGLMKALKAGSASVTITDPGTANLKAVSFTVTVKVEKAAADGGTDGGNGQAGEPGAGEKVEIGSSTITLEKSAYTYTGKALKPVVTVSCGGRTLTEDTDYVVSYLNNVNAGQGTVRITGKGNYTGQADQTFTIKKKAQKITAKNITLVRSSKKQKKKLGVKVLGGAKVTYTPSDKKVKIAKGKVTIPAKFTGLCKIKIKAAPTKNYKGGSKTIKITVNPPATKLTGLSVSSGKKAFKISWKAVSGVTGYEAQMAADGEFKKSVKKAKVKATSAEFFYTEGKTCYFRVRTYKKAGGKLYYSKWSKVEYRKAG